MGSSSPWRAGESVRNSVSGKRRLAGTGWEKRPTSANDTIQDGALDAHPGGKVNCVVSSGRVPIKQLRWMTQDADDDGHGCVVSRYGDDGGECGL